MSDVKEELLLLKDKLDNLEIFKATHQVNNTWCILLQREYNLTKADILSRLRDTLPKRDQFYV